MIATPLLLTGLGVSSKIVQGEDPSLASAIALVGSSVTAQNFGLPAESLPLAPTPGGTEESFVSDVANAAKDDPLLQSQLDKYSSTHQINQIANGESHITLDAKIISDETIPLQSGDQRIIEIEQQVVDQRYFEHGNLADFTATIRAGHIPTIDAAFLALIDVLDTVTLSALRPILMHWKIDSHILHRTVEIRVDDLTTDGVENVPQKVDKNVDRQIEENSILDTTLETVNTKTIDKQILSHIEGKQITTITYAPHVHTHSISDAQIEKMERKSFVTAQEYDRTAETIQSTTTESKQIWGFDFGEIVGKKVTPGQETQSIGDTFKLRIYESKDGGDFSQALADGKLTEDEARDLKLALVDEKRTDAPAQISVLAEGGVKQFESGFIDWLPLGSLVSMGVKSSYGLDVTASDAFWAATDVVLSVGTMGTATIIANSAKAVGKQAAKGIAKGALRETAEVMAKEGNKVGRAVFDDIKDFTPDFFKQSNKLPVWSQEKTTRSGMKTFVNDELAHRAKTGAHTAENSAEAVGKRSVPETSRPSQKRHSADSQATTNAGTKPRGGAYNEVKTPGTHAHHIPSNDASPYAKDKGPSISMDPTDHRKTASYGNSAEARAYRAKQEELIKQGKFDEAQKMDIDDIRSKFGAKYDQEIEEMLEYTKKLRSTQA